MSNCETGLKMILAAAIAGAANGIITGFAAGGCSTAPQNANVTAQRRMQ
jgi:hypothetical protein